MAICKECVHNEVCKYGEKRSNGMYCTGEKCKQFKDRTKYVEVVRCKDCKHFVSPQGVPCCDEFMGLGFPNADGSDFCSYGERREGE